MLIAQLSTRQPPRAPTLSFGREPTELAGQPLAACDTKRAYAEFAPVLDLTRACQAPELQAFRRLELAPYVAPTSAFARRLGFRFLPGPSRASVSWAVACFLFFIS